MTEEIINQMTLEELTEYKDHQSKLKRCKEIYENTWNSAWASRTGVDFTNDINKASESQHYAENALKNFVKKMESKYATRKMQSENLAVAEPIFDKQSDSVSLSSRDNHSEEVEGLVESYIDYSIKKYGKDAINYMLCFMQGNVNGITRDCNFRQLFKQYGITPSVVSYICGGDIKGYYNSKVQSSMNIDFQEGIMTR